MSITVIYPIIAENPRPEVPTEFSRDFMLAENPNRRIKIDGKVIVGLMGSKTHHGGVDVFLTADTGIPIISVRPDWKKVAGNQKNHKLQAEYQLCSQNLGNNFLLYGLVKSAETT